MEERTSSFEREVVNREILFHDRVGTVVVKNVWDADDTSIPWEDALGKKSHTYHDCVVRLERTRYHSAYIGSYDIDTLFINNKKYDALDIKRCRGNTLKLEVTASIGQG